MTIELNYLASLGRFVPELVVSLTMLILVLLEATYGTEEKERPMVFWTSAVGLFIAALSITSSLGEEPVSIFTGSLVIDAFSGFAKLIMILGTLGALIISRQSTDLAYDVKSEFAIMAMGVLIGGMLLASADNMLVLYISIEMLSILSYVMAALKKHDEHSCEAGLKYVLYGGVSSGVMLFGMSHIFGVLGSIHYGHIASNISSLDTSQIWILMPSFLLFFAGLGYKIACVPFHMWSPDVYEGSPIPVTAFFSIVPKLAGIAALARVTFVFFSGEGVLQHSWIGVLQVVAVLTMTVGNVSAIGQRSIKRMLAYSSISHVGFILLGIVSIDSAGLAAILFYGFVYLFMTLVAFTITSYVQNQFGNDHFDRFEGMIFKYPLVSILMAIVMFSLAGIPPLGGFVAKFNIIAAVVAKKYYALAVVALINSVISLYYYLKIVRLMVFKMPESDEPIGGFTYANRFLLTILTLPIVFFGIFWSKLYHIVDTSTMMLRQ